jgi:hypothetical protein
MTEESTPVILDGEPSKRRKIGNRQFPTGKKDLLAKLIKCLEAIPADNRESIVKEALQQIANKEGRTDRMKRFEAMSDDEQERRLKAPI